MSLTFKKTPSGSDVTPGKTALIALAGAALGALAWVALPWATGLAITFPFLLGLLNRKRETFAFAAAYHLGALSFMPLGSLTGGAEVVDSVLSIALWIAGAVLAGWLWSMALDPKGRAIHTGVRLFVVWQLALFTPFGLMGAVHPMWGWAFSGEGFMGVASLVVAPLLTAFLVLAIRHQRHDGTSAWSWHSGRVLSLVICAVIIGKGLGDHTKVSSQAGRVAGLQSSWGQLGVKQGASLEHRLSRIKGALRDLTPDPNKPAVVDMLLSGTSAFGVQEERNVAGFAQASLSPQDVGSVAVGLGLKVTSGAASNPCLVVVRRAAEPVVYCSSNLPVLALSWAFSSAQACLFCNRAVVVSEGRLASQTMRIVIGDEALFGGLQALLQMMSPVHSIALVTSSAAPGEQLVQRVQAKHFNALGYLMKTPHLMATNKVDTIN